MPPRPHYGGNSAENSPTRLSRRYPRPKALEDHISDALRYRFYTFYATIFTSSMRPLVDTMPNSPALSANVLESRRKDRPLPCSPSISTGSSPLTRGAPSSRTSRFRQVGLIPAHAGSTQGDFGFVTTAGAHPRSRGEHRTDSGDCDSRTGSSPLTRGALYMKLSNIAPNRLIPAHAGSTAPAKSFCQGQTAHPRSRGEHQIDDVNTLMGQGSSPLTRGALRARRRLSCCSRLIPAHAGSTLTPHQSTHQGPAHPRSRGEHGLPWFNWLIQWGSSPLTRGAHPSRIGNMRRPRLIPAHAGSTGGQLLSDSEARAHPRSRGEHIGSKTNPPTSVGSSPLTRGAPSTPFLFLPVPGLIPAHAGSTVNAIPIPPCTRAHPRSRGEHFVGFVAPPGEWGSSPLTRGAPAWDTITGKPTRLIPAHAGSTDSHPPVC